MSTLLPALAATAAPTALLTAIAYTLRPQGGRLRTHPRPAQRVLAACENDRAAGLVPGDSWGGVHRTTRWTVRTDDAALMAELGDTQQMPTIPPTTQE